MAYRSSMIARRKLFYQLQKQFSPSSSHVTSISRTVSTNSEICSRFLVTGKYASNSLLWGNVSRLTVTAFMMPANSGLIFHRKFSNKPLEIEIVHDAAAVEAAEVVNEVAAAAADSFAPVAAFQYLIDYVHCFTGFEWWASIAATTVLIRFIALPVLIHKLKCKCKYPPTLLRQQNLTIENLWRSYKEDSDLDEATAKIEEFLKKSGIFQLGVGLLMTDVSACILFFAILNMAEKVPSFATGGTLWFTDLTTPSSIHLPILLALTFWIRWESQLTLWIRLKLDEVNHVQGVTLRKNANKFCAAVTLLGAVTAELPTAIYCYWITSNLFSIAFAIVMMDPQIQKLLGLSIKSPSFRKENEKEE